MGSMKLASAGDDIKIWDVNSLSVIKQYNPHDQNVTSLCWSHDNTYLSSASGNGKKLGIAVVKNSSVTALDPKTITGSNFVDYNSSSRYILSGETNMINVWDLASWNLKKTYKGHSGAVTCAKFNWNDTYIASASETGEIIVFNALTGRGCSPMVAPKVQSIKQIQYSQYQKKLLGSVSDDGSVNLWDTNTHRLIHSFTNAHRAPATGLSFSPINEIFLLSVGLDKRICCYDLEGKRCLKTIVAESPLTSIDVMPDGTTMAVGSTRGKIYLYDLRRGNLPINILNAHKSSVQCLKFQCNVSDVSQSKVNNSKVTMETSPTGRRQLPSAPKETPQRETNEMESFEEDVLSPLGNGTTEMRLSTGTPQGLEADNSNSTRHSFKLNNYSSGSVFSPLADMDKVGGASLSASDSGLAQPSKTTLNWNAFSPENTYQSSNGIETNTSNYQPHTSHQSSPGRSLPLSGRSPPSYPTTRTHTSPPSHQTGTSHPSPRSSTLGDGYNVSEDFLKLSPRDLSQKQKLMNGSNSHNASPRSSGHGFTGSPELPVKLTSPSGTSGSSHVDDLSSATAGSYVAGAHSVDSVIKHKQLDCSAAEAAQSQNFQSQLLRNIVHDVTEEQKDALHKDILNLLVVMLREFQTLQYEMTNILQQYSEKSVNHRLVMAVERLGDEVKMLKLEQREESKKMKLEVEKLRDDMNILKRKF